MLSACAHRTLADESQIVIVLRKWNAHKHAYYFSIVHNLIALTYETEVACQ